MGNQLFLELQLLIFKITFCLCLCNIPNLLFRGVMNLQIEIGRIAANRNGICNEGQ